MRSQGSAALGIAGSFAAGAAICTALACAGEPDDRPPLLRECGSEPCEGFNLSGRFGSSVPEPEPGGGGAAGAIGEDVTLEGEVVVYLDDRFEPADPLADPARVSSFDRDGALVSTVFDGTEPFELEGVAALSLNWVGVEPLLDDFELLASLHPVDTRAPPSLSLGVARIDTLSQIYASVTAQATVDLEGAHVLLFFLDAAGEPVSGVEVSTSGAEFVAYATGETWDDTLGETSNRGAALIGNVPAPSFPGSNAVVSTAGALPGAITLRMAAGTLTISEVSR